MYPKSRIDALTDGIFAVAMTLLVLDIKLPDDFHPRDDAEFLYGLADLFPRVWPYMLSFIVLGQRWLLGLGDRAESGPVSRRYARWWLFYLLLITMFPFTTVVMGRYPDNAPAIWLYAGANLLGAMVTLRMTALMPGTHSAPLLLERRITIAGLAVASVLAIVWSFWDPRLAPLSYLLILVAPLFGKLRKQRSPAAHKGASR